MSINREVHVQAKWVFDFLSTLLAIFLNNRQLRLVYTEVTEKRPVVERAPGLLLVDELASGPSGQRNQPKALVVYFFNMNRRLERNIREVRWWGGVTASERCGGVQFFGTLFLKP